MSKDEQLSTWMDRIWSCRCLELLCTSTQSSNLKWVSGGGINSPRQPNSRWLTATEKESIRWTDAIIFQGVGSSGAPPTSHSRWGSLTQLLWRYAPMVHQMIRCWRTLHQTLTVCIFKSVGWTSASPLVHPVLKLQSWRVSVLIQMKRRIDRRCSHSDRRIIRCYCLRFFFSATRPTLLESGPSVHPTVPQFSPSVPTRPTIAPTLAI
jgi:hypothetical protein